MNLFTCALLNNRAVALRGLLIHSLGLIPRFADHPQSCSTTKPNFPHICHESMPHGPLLPGLTPLTTHPSFSRSPGPDPEDRHTSASEPSSPIPIDPPSSSRARLRQRHKSRSTASLAEYTSQSYWIPGGSIPTPGPSAPPRYTSQSEGDGEDSDRERDPILLRSSRLWGERANGSPNMKAIRTGQGTETEDPDAYDTSTVSPLHPS